MCDTVTVEDSAWCNKMSWILLNIHMLDWLLLGCDVYSKDFEKEVIELLQDVGIG